MTRRLASVALFLAVFLAAAALPQQAASEEQVFAVEGMTCSLCGKAIEKSLRGVEGVRDVRIDLEAERVTVVAAPKVGADSLLTAIESAGSYTAAPVEPSGS